MEQQLKKITNFIANNSRTFAKTYATTAPHEYLVKKNLSAENQKMMIEFAKFIKENGYKKMFGTVEFTYYDIGDWMYRSMDDPVESTDLINRANK